MYEDKTEDQEWLPPVTIRGRVETPSLQSEVGHVPLPPTNPFHIQALALAEAQDKQGLIDLDAHLASIDYSPTGQARLFIAATLATLGA